MSASYAVVGGGILGCRRRAAAAGRRPRRERHGLGEGGPARRPPDRPQLRRRARRPLLPARLPQGDAVPARGRDAARVLRGARDRVRRVRQGPRRARRRRGGPPRRHRGEGPRQRRPRRPSDPGDELREIEPHVRGVGGLHSPTTAIVDFPGGHPQARRAGRARRGTVRLSTEMTGIRTDGDGVVLTGRTAGGEAREERFDRVVLCTGLWADHTAEWAGDTPEPKVVPFRGEYWLLRPERRSLVNGLIYPVPDPRYPFLGVHMTPRVDGEVMVGPNAVLALAREGYDWRTVSPRDLREIAAYAGFRRFARKHWATGVREMAGSLSKRRFVAAARRYVPDISVDDVVPGPNGIRAQTLEPRRRDGRRLPHHHPWPGHRPAQRAVARRHVQPGHRRARRRRRARPPERPPDDRSRPHARPRARPRPRSLGRPGVAVRRRPRPRRRVARAPAPAGRLRLGPGCRGPRRLRGGRRAEPRRAAAGGPYRHRIVGPPGRPRPLRPHDRRRGRPGRGVPRGGPPPARRPDGPGQLAPRRCPRGALHQDPRGHRAPGRACRTTPPCRA